MRKQWSEEAVVNDLTAICKSIGHFPSFTELKEMGRNDLMCQVSRRGGVVFFSQKVGYSRVWSDTDTGWDGERRVASIITSDGFVVEKSLGYRSPYDLLVEGIARIDVKTAGRVTYKNGNHGFCTGWFYRVGKEPTCDFVVLYRKDREDCFVIPWHKSTTTNITISEGGGIYAPYYNNWGILRDFVARNKI